MAQHLTDQNIQDIVEILDYWSPNEKLTWERLCKAIEVQLELVPAPTRQTLQKFARIKNAYDLGKKISNSFKNIEIKTTKASCKLENCSS